MRHVRSTIRCITLLFLLTIVGCDFFASLFSPIVGTWTLYYDWNSTGTYLNTSIEFKSDNTFTESNRTGTWALDGKDFTFSYGTNSTTYTGTLDPQGQLSGTMVSWQGTPGQWYAEKD